MKRVIIIFSIFIFFIYCGVKSYKTFESLIHDTVKEKTISLTKVLSELDSTDNKTALIASFKKARTEYKIIEPFIEYYYQGLSRRINGPALPEIKTDDNMVNDPSGFQVIEELVYEDSLDKAEISKQVNILKTDLLFVAQNFNQLPIQDHHFYELIQHQIIRIATLGITGFDSPVGFNSIDEAHASIQGIEEFYNLYGTYNNKKLNPKLLALLKSNKVYISQNKDFNSFNRLSYIKQHLMPLSIEIEKEFKEVIAKNKYFESNKFFYGTLSDLMQGKKINADAFTPFADSKTTKEKITLGKVLFSSTSLSKSNNLSCASCHNAEKAFADQKTTSLANVHSTSVKRNSPTLYYAALQKSFFYDMRSQDLENQIEDVMKNPDEFNLSPNEINNKIKGNKEMQDLFNKAFPNKTTITPYEIRNAIASYVKSLIPFNSKIDQYFKGETTLSKSEINGFNIFAGKAKCATCHFIPIYNGTVPPWYNNTESEVIGVPKSQIWKNAVVDSDIGRYKLNQLEQLKYSFKTPTVRNAEKTGPYMHNGVYKSLDEVIRFYELGGGNGIGMQLEYQTLPFDHLNLTETEKQDIISFIKTLTDK
jgi:cytochrome c peroxidase